MAIGTDISALGARTQPLAGVVAVEVGSSLPGRLLAKLLADQGATVRHVVVAGAPLVAYDFDDAGTPEALALASDEGRRELLVAAASADIVIDGLPAGLVAFGLGEETLGAARPGLISCRLRPMPAEAPEGPDECVEWLIAGALGLHRPGAATEREPLSIASAYGAMQAALYLAAALIQRDRTGQGGEIEVSLFGAAMMALNRRLLDVADPRYADPLGKYRVPIAERYRCADGRYLQSQGAVDSVATSVVQAMGHPEWTDGVVAGLTALGSEEEERLWRERFTEAYASRDALEWESAVAAAGGAGAVCRTREEWKHEEHASEAEIFVAGSDGERALGAGVRIFSPPTLAGEPAPWPAQAEPRLPLSGLKVVDLAIILAGPTCGRLLGELGADVVKIDAPDRTELPWVSPWGWLDVNRTKRSALVDLKTEEGREILWRLLEQADVLVENYRAGKIASLGFSFEEVARRNPRIVYVSMNAYDFGGPFTARPGWEQNAQAMTAMQASRAKEGFPRQVLLPVNDFGTGYLGAYGTLLGIYAARRSGHAQRVFGSLSRTGTFLQALEYGQRAPLPAGPEVQFHEAADGTVAVAAAPSDGAVAALVAGRERASALAALAEAGYLAGPAHRPEEVPHLEWVRKAGLIGDWEHPSWGEMTNVFAHANAATFEQRRGWPAQNPGQESREVLAEAGYSPAEIDGLIARGAAFEELPLFRGSEPAESPPRRDRP